MNKFFTLSVLALLMLGNHSGAMETEVLKQRKKELKGKIGVMVSKDPKYLLELKETSLEAILLSNAFNSGDHADVFSKIITDTKDKPFFCCTIIEKFVKEFKFGVNGFNLWGTTPLTCAVSLYLIGLVKSPIVVERLLKLGADPYKKEKVLPNYSNSIYERVNYYVPRSDKKSCYIQLPRAIGILFNVNEDPIDIIKRKNELIELFNKYVTKKGST